jgi:hypothetical protein
LKASIKTLSVRSKGKQSIRFNVGPTVRRKLKGGQKFRRVGGKVREVLGYPYGAAVEFGHSFPGGREETISSGSRFGTDVKPRPYLRPAWNNNKNRVLSTFGSEAGKGIERLASKKA